LTYLIVWKYILQPPSTRNAVSYATFQAKVCLSTKLQSRRLPADRAIAKCLQLPG
jgi:hypothetical protein